MTFNQCRLQDAEGWTTVKWIPTALAQIGTPMRFGPWDCAVKVVYWPALPATIFEAQR